MSPPDSEKQPGEHSPTRPRQNASKQSWSEIPLKVPEGEVWDTVCTNWQLGGWGLEKTESYGNGWKADNGVRTLVVLGRYL